MTKASDGRPIHVRDAESIGMTALIWVLVRRRGVLGLVTLLGTVGGAALGLLLDPVYEAETSFVPSKALESPGATAGSSFIAAAQQFGLSGVQTSDPTELFRSILFSNAFLDRMAEEEIATGSGRVRLDSLLLGEQPADPKQHKKAIDRLSSALRFEVDTKSGVVTTSLRLEDQDVVAHALDHVVQELDRKHRTLVGARVAAELRFIGSRLEEAEASLREAEEAVRVFLDRNQRVADSPHLSLQLDRLQREVQVRQRLFLTLREQYEFSQIREVRELPEISVLDPAQRPVGSAWPSVPLLTILGCVLGFVAVTATVLTVDFARYPPEPRPLANAVETPGTI